MVGKGLSYHPEIQSQISKTILFFIGIKCCCILYHLYKKLDIIPLGEAKLTGKNVGSYGPAENKLYSVPFVSTFQVGTLII